MNKKLLQEVIDVAAKLHKLQPQDLQTMLDHVQDNGTDHDDGLPVDTLTEAMLEAAALQAEDV